MKTLHLTIIVFSILGLLIVTSPVYAPCLIGVSDCGPPPGVTVSTWTDSQFYEKNDTINIKGKLYVENYTNPVKIQIINPTNMILKTLDSTVTKKTFSVKINANFNESGMYQIVSCVKSWCDRSYFKYTAEPYNLSFNGRDYLIWYKSIADLQKIDADLGEKALQVHISGATAEGLQFVITLPRDLIDFQSVRGDQNFTVLVGAQQPDKYMQPATFKEIATNSLSRTLAIDIPYKPISDVQGIWDFKITGPDVLSGQSVFIATPLKQFKSGIKPQDVKCKEGLQLIIKSEDDSPACVKLDTAKKLIASGWGMMSDLALTNNTLKNNCGQFYTIPHDSYSNGSETYPVLILKQNSIGCAKLTYSINYNYNDNRSGSIWSQVLNFTDLFHMGKYNYTTHGNSFGVSSIDTMQMFKVKIIPETVDLAKYPVGSQFTVTLIIQPMPNATGFYDYSIEEIPCDAYPLEVGYGQDQINSSDFSKGMIGMHNHSCAIMPYEISLVQVSGMDFKLVKFP